MKCWHGLQCLLEEQPVPFVTLGLSLCTSLLSYHPLVLTQIWGPECVGGDDSWVDLSSQEGPGSVSLRECPSFSSSQASVSSVGKPCASRAHLVVIRSDLVLIIMIWVSISHLLLGSAFVHGRLRSQHVNRSQRSGSGPLLLCCSSSKVDVSCSVHIRHWGLFYIR